MHDAASRRREERLANANMIHEFRTKDHPEANGRTPKKGEQEFSLKFPLENGDVLVVKMGKEGWDTVGQFILDEAIDRPSYSDEG